MDASPERWICLCISPDASDLHWSVFLTQIPYDISRNHLPTNTMTQWLSSLVRCVATRVVGQSSRKVLQSLKDVSTPDTICIRLMHFVSLLITVTSCTLWTRFILLRT